ncbi:MAG: SH3 domain-containing protein [Candidatus Aminicenantales bacterium]
MMTLKRFRIVSILCLGLVLVVPAQERKAQTVKLRVSAEQANLREKPDIGSAVVQQIPEGTVLEADKKEGEWYLVRYTLEDGGVIAGYIHESLVVVESQPGAVGEPQAAPAKPAPGPQKMPAGEPKPIAIPAYESVVPVEVFLSAGVSTIIADDFNKGVRGLADSNGALLGATPGSSVNALRLTYCLGVEIFYRASPWISIGLGVDDLNGYRSSRVDYPPADPGLAAPYTTARLSVQAIPVKVSVRFYPRPDFYVKGSFAYYTVKAGYNYRFVPSEASWQEWRGQATAHTLGMEVAAGGEWALSSHMLVFAEAGFRLAQLDKFSGTGSFRDSAGTSSTEAGSLWYYQQRGADARGYDLLLILASGPSGADILGARRATLNLSGPTLKAGVKFRF